MPAVWLKVRFKGGSGEVEAESLLNSGSDIVVLPRKIATKIDPTHVGKVEVELADGSVRERDAYEIEIEVENPETGEKRRAKVLSTIEKRDYPMIGIEGLEKLKLTLDVVRGKALFVE